MGAAPARSGTGPGVPDINPLAANILSTLLNPGAGAALANSMAMLQNPGPSGGTCYLMENSLVFLYEKNSTFGIIIILMHKLHLYLQAHMVHLETKAILLLVEIEWILTVAAAMLRETIG